MIQHKFLALLLGTGLVLFSCFAQAQTITIGDSTVLKTADSGNGNLLLAQQATLSQIATINSLSFYVTKAAGNLRLGIYDATGPGGNPGALLAQTNSIVTVKGWNTANVITPVSLPAGSYWLAYLPSSSSLSFVKENSTGACVYAGFNFAALPATFATSTSSCTATNWSFYATLTPGGGGGGGTVNGACGSSNGGDFTSAPTTNLCTAGTASAVSGSGPWTWSCAGSGGGSTASCSANLEINGSCGAANGVAVSSKPTTGLCTAGTASSVSGTGPWNWSCTGSNGGSTASCSAPLLQTVNGTCGSANGGDFTSKPTTNLCSAGSASSVSGTGPWTWSCAGSGGGSTASCSAQLEVNGSCGAANGVAVSTAPTTNLCSAGSASSVSGTGPWSWSCTGSNGGSTASCSAPLLQVVNGACGSANGTTVYTIPTTNLCSAGTASSVGGTGPWNWSCAGTNGGTTAQCSANLEPDTTAPTVPTGLTATAISSTQINLSWTASTDNVGVTGYQIFRNSVLVGTTASASYSDTGLTASTLYMYNVTAFDAAGNVSAQSGSASATTPVTSAGTPTLIQHVASSANPVGVGISGNNFKIPLPNLVGAGNTLIMGITYPHGSGVPTITDSNGNTWSTLAMSSADGGPGNYVMGVWVLSNANAGQTTITVSFSAAVIPFNYVISEFNNIATVNPVNGATVVTNQKGPSLSTGAFTPNNNDVNGGNLIWSYYALGSIAAGNPSSWASGTGFSLLDADISWTTKQGFPHASQFMVQPTAASINPGITATSDSADYYNGVTIALAAASAGTAAPAGIHINKIIHQTTAIPSTSLMLQEPATGNLRVLVTADNPNIINVTSVTDSDGNSWTGVPNSGDSPMIWYAANTSPDPNVMVTVHSSGVHAGGTWLFYDVSGAAAEPYDVSANQPDVNVTEMTVINNMPTITPTTTNGLVIGVMGLGQGPGLGLAAGSPPGGIFDFVTYTGELDLDLMENADCQAHVYNTTTNPITWNWNITAEPNDSGDAASVAFKAAGP